MLREHDVLCDKLAPPLKKAHAGPEPSGGYRVDLWLPTAARAEVSA